MKAIKRHIAFFLVLIMVTSPLSVLVETNAANSVNTLATNGYNEKLFEEMVTLYEGDEGKARTALDALYANGLIDSEGNMVFGETFAVEGAIDGSEDIIVELSRIEGESAGNYAIVGTFNDNYEVTFMGNYLTIKKKAEDPIPTLYTVSGIVTDNNAENGDITVTIMQGSKIFGKSIINSGESYSFANLAAGAYNITATNGNESKTIYVELADDTTEGIITEDIIIGTQSAACCGYKRSTG